MLSDGKTYVRAYSRVLIPTHIHRQHSQVGVGVLQGKEKVKCFKLLTPIQFKDSQNVMTNQIEFFFSSNFKIAFEFFHLHP